MMGVIPRQIRACEENNISPLFACLLKGQEIYTRYGIKPIEELVIGDEVLTHSGVYKQVTSTMARKYHGKLYTVRLSGGRKGKRLSLTEKHPILVRDRKGELKWTTVEKIECGYHGRPGGLKNHKSYVCFPKSCGTTKFLNLSSYLSDKFHPDTDGCIVGSKSGKKWKQITEFMEITYEFAYFLGMFAAEGSFSKVNGKLTGGMRISLHASELYIVEKVATFLRTYGIECSVYTIDNKLDLCFCCAPFADLLAKLVGVGCRNKKTPSEILAAPVEIQKAFLDGLLAGDGKNPFIESNKSKQQTLRITSKILAWQAKLLLANLGHWVNVYKRTEWAKDSKKKKTIYCVPISLMGKYRRCLEDDKYIYKPIASISCQDVETNVYNIEVEDDNSYVSDFVLHNCELYLQDKHPSKDVFEKMTSEEKKGIRKSYHLLAIACNNTGYSNLVKLSSWAWLHGYYYRPRVTHEQLLKHKEGIIFTSCCYNSEIGQAFDKSGEDAAYAMIEKYRDQFGENFYLELMLLDFAKQKPYDEFIIKAHDKYKIPLIVTNDCLPGDTLVDTFDRGLKRLDEVCVGDLVKTHKGRYREVQVIASRKSDVIYDVRSKCGGTVFSATGNHKVQVAKNINGEFVLSWKKILELAKDDYLLKRKLSISDFCKNDDVKSIDLCSLLDGKYKTSKNKCGLWLDADNFRSGHRFDCKNDIIIPRYLPCDNDFMRVLGWYIAEGSCDITSYKLHFALHESEVEVAEFLCKYFRKFGIHPKIVQVTKHGIAVELSSKVFNIVFRKLAGHRGDKKRLPSFNNPWFAKCWSWNQLREIIKAWAEGDGHRSKRVKSFFSTSKRLMYEVCCVLTSLGFPCQPYRRDNLAKGWNDLWCISFSKNRAIELDKCLNGESFSQSCGFWKDAGEFWATKYLKRVERIHEDIVYDLQIEEDESFTANLMSVHNCHYCNEEDSRYQRYMLMIQKETSIKEIEKKLSAEDRMDIFELQDSNLWMKSEQELNQKWWDMYKDVIPYELYVQAKKNTVEICKKAKGVEIDRSVKLPQFPDAEDRLKDAIVAGAKWRGAGGNKKYVDRLKEEYELICRKGFASYFLIQKQITDEARRICPSLLGWGDGSEAVGPGRGSAVGSLVCYCLGITDVDPIKHNLLFSRFLSESRGGKSVKLRFSKKVA